MSTTTTNLQLKKPAMTDLVSTTITDLGNNFDIIDASLAESTQIKGTTQNITWNSDGTVQMIQHVDGSNNVLRTDAFTYATNLITEVRTVGSNTLTFKYHLDTLQTEVI